MHLVQSVDTSVKTVPDQHTGSQSGRSVEF